MRFLIRSVLSLVLLQVVITTSPMLALAAQNGLFRSAQEIKGGAALIETTTEKALPGNTSPNVSGNNPHGDYFSRTDKCSFCHRTNSGQSGGALVTPDITSLCLNCHGNSGQGAGTNVENGIWDGSNPATKGQGTVGSRLNGGGFKTTQGVATTSSHDVKGLNGSTGMGTAWGYVDRSSGVSGVLECTSCHDPHGNNNYRMLRNGGKWAANNQKLGAWQDSLVSTSHDDVSQGGTAKSYTYVADSLMSPPSNNRIQAAYTENISLFCSTCHVGYATSARSHPSYLRVNFEETPKNPLVFALSPDTSDASQTRITCLTCHFAHGTTATMSSLATVAPTNDSALLVYNNRGICVSCHLLDK